MGNKEQDFLELIKRANDYIANEDNRLSKEIADKILDNALFEPVSQIEDQEMKEEFVKNLIKVLSSSTELPDITCRMVNIAIINKVEFIRKCIGILQSCFGLEVQERFQTFLDETSLIFELKGTYIAFGKSGTEEEQLFLELLNAADTVSLTIRESDDDTYMQISIEVKDIIINK